MKILDKYILKSFLPPFIITFFVVLLIFVLQILWLYADDIVGKGIDTIIIIELMMYMSASMVPMALPVSILLSSIMAFGNLSENSELTAFKTAGVPLWRIMLSLIILMVITAYGAFLFSNHVIPYANFKSENMLYNIVQQKPALQLQNGVFTQVGDFSIRVMEKTPIDEVRDSIKDVLIHDLSSNRGAVSVIVARRGSISTSPDKRYMVLSLYDGHMYEEEISPNYAQRTHQVINKSSFDHQVLPVDISSFSQDDLKKEDEKDKHSMLNISQLRHALDSLQEKYTGRLKMFAMELGQNNYISSFPTDSSLLDYESKISGVRDVYKRASMVDEALDSMIAHFPITVEDRMNGASLLPAKYIFSGIDIDPRDTLSEAITFVPSKHISRKDVYRAAENQVRNAMDYLSTYSEGLRASGERINMFGLEIQRKYALAFAVIVLFFVGAPLGALIRKGGFGLPVVVAIAIFMVYNVLFMFGEKMGKEGTLDVITARWLPTLVLLPLGVWLTYRATKDAVIVNLDPLLVKMDAMWARVPEKYKQKIKSLFVRKS